MVSCVLLPVAVFKHFGSFQALLDVWKRCSLTAARVLEKTTGSKKHETIVEVSGFEQHTSWNERVPDCVFLRAKKSDTDMYVQQHTHFLVHVRVRVSVCLCVCLLCGAFSCRVSRVVARYFLFVVRHWSLVVDCPSFCVVACCCFCRVSVDLVLSYLLVACGIKWPFFFLSLSLSSSSPFLLSHAPVCRFETSPVCTGTTCTGFSACHTTHHTT